MATTIGHRGVLEILTPGAGPKRKPIRIVSFVGLSAAGGVVHPMFDASRHPIAVIDVDEGKLRTAEFSDTGDTTGELTQIDTGPSGHVMLSIWADTGI
jgi:hypothetical protein